MRSISKFLLIATVAGLSVAVAAVPSEAATKKKKKAAAAPAETAEVMPAASTGCGEGGLCAKDCSDQGCQVYFCAADKSWQPALLTPFCIKGQCPPRF